MTFRNPLGAARLPPVLHAMVIGTLNGLAIPFVAFLVVVFTGLVVRYRAGGQSLPAAGQVAAPGGSRDARRPDGRLALPEGRPAWPAHIGYDLVSISELFGIPVAMTIAILRHRLFDFDAIISRAVAYGLLSAAFTGVYVAIVVGLGAVRLAGHGSSLRFTIADDGAGFDAASTPSGSGLQGMTDRLAASGAHPPHPVSARERDHADRRAAGITARRSPAHHPTRDTGAGSLMNAHVTTWRAEPDIRDMMVIHRIFRREFPLLAEIVPRASNGNARRAVHVARHIDFCLDSLHNHHSAEDEYLWPKLLERTRPHAELVRRMEAQHKDVAGCVEQARQRTAHWQAVPVPDGNRARDGTGAAQQRAHGASR